MMVGGLARRGLAVFVALVMSTSVFAKPFVYPSKGQSAEQQRRDEADCHQWAYQHTGIDPARSAAAAPATTGGGGSVLRGAARGAAVGALGGAIAGDAGKGAAIGAAAGGLMGGMRRRRRAMQQQQYQQQQAAMQQQQVAEFDRAFGACLAGRGYTVR